jgi:hypothetical protein
MIRASGRWHVELETGVTVGWLIGFGARHTKIRT